MDQTAASFLSRSINSAKKRSTGVAAHSTIREV